MNRESLLEQVDTWIRSAAVVASYARGSNGGEFMTLAQMSEYLEIRWFMFSGGVRIQLEHNWEASNGDYWLGCFSLGGIDPYLLAFKRGDIPAEEDMIAAEEVIKITFPYIKLIRCHYCESHIVSENKEGEWFCSNCLGLIPTQKDKAGFVYVFGSIEEGCYKIGQGVKPKARMRDYQLSKLPFSVEMIHIIPVDDKARAEADLHKRYGDKRTNGEWFRLSPDELGVITGLRGYRAGEWVRG